DQVEIAVQTHGAQVPVFGRDVKIERVQRELGVAARTHRGVAELVDGRGQHHAAPLLGIGRDVGAAAREGKPERRARAHQGLHALFSFLARIAGHSRCAWASPWGVPMSNSLPGQRLAESGSPSATSRGKTSVSRLDGLPFGTISSSAGSQKKRPPLTQPSPFFSFSRNAVTRPSPAISLLPPPFPSPPSH